MMRFSSSYGNMWMCFWGLLFCTIAGTTTTLAETQNSIVDIAEKDGEGRFTTLVSLLDTTNLKPVLEDHAGYNSFFAIPKVGFIFRGFVLHIRSSPQRMRLSSKH